MENKYNINIGLIDSIDRQIKELQRRKEALQRGYWGSCYIPGLYKAETYSDLNIRLLDKEENK